MTNKFQETPPNELHDRFGSERVDARKRLYFAKPWKIDGDLVDQNETPVVFVSNNTGEGHEYGYGLPTYPQHGSGHGWGYGGSGPAQLALDLLLDVLGEWPTRHEMDKGNCLAWMLHQHFKDEVIARLDGNEGWQMPGILIVCWVRDFIERNPERYNEWLLGVEEEKLINAMAVFEQRIEDGETLTQSEQEAFDVLCGSIGAIDLFRDQAEHYGLRTRVMSDYAASHGYPPFAASAAVDAS